MKIKKILLSIVASVALTMSAFGQVDTVNVGTGPNAGDGDNLRAAFLKVNANDLWGQTRISQLADSMSAALDTIRVIYNDSIPALRTDIGSGGSMTYPGAGIALSTGSAWGSSITDNSANWNTAYGWGNHASEGYLTAGGSLTNNAILYYNDPGSTWTAVAMSGDVSINAGVTTIADDAVQIDDLDATGTADATTYLRGDGAWATPAGAGDVTAGTGAAATRIAVWESGSAIGGNADFTFAVDSLQIDGSGLSARGLTVNGQFMSSSLVDDLNDLTTKGHELISAADAPTALGYLGLTATASEINTPLDGASVTLTEFQELETIGSTTISATQWGYLGDADIAIDSASLHSRFLAASDTVEVTYGYGLDTSWTSSNAMTLTVDTTNEIASKLYVNAYVASNGGGGGSSDSSWTSVNFIPISSPPSTAEGDVYYDSDTDLLLMYDGSQWDTLNTAGGSGLSSAQVHLLTDTIPKYTFMAGTGAAGDTSYFASGADDFGMFYHTKDTLECLVRLNYMSASDSMKFNIYWGNYQSDTKSDSLFDAPEAVGTNQRGYLTVDDPKIPPAQDVWMETSGTQIPGSKPIKAIVQLDQKAIIRD